MAVWSEPLLERSQLAHPVAELGATGLGLVALAAVNDAAPGTVPLEQLQALGRFLLFMQRGDGSFTSKYISKRGPVSNWESLYYPGEAALGLVSLYRADHSRKWLVAAAKALSYLARSRESLVTLPADHWALIATAELIRYGAQMGSIVSREELIHHAIQICNSILHEQLTNSAADGLDGAFDPTGRTTPVATRLEGLQSALEFLPSGELTNEIGVATGRGIAFLLRAQIITGPFIGGLPKAATLNKVDSSDIRIDYVQHALCAWIRYLRLIHISKQTIEDLKRAAVAPGVGGGDFRP